MKKIYMLAFVFTLFASLSFAQQIPVTSLTSTQIPKEIKYKGKLNVALTWKDSMGNHILITSETGYFIDKNVEHIEEGRDAALYADHYILENNKPKLIWRAYDFQNDCPFDINMDFIPKTTLITDLNKDGIVEIWLMYKKGCRSDVSPVEMKIIMYNGQKKFAMRGQNKVQVSATEFSGGENVLDKSFTAGPKEFRAFAQKLWKENLIDRFSKP